MVEAIKREFLEELIEEIVTNEGIINAKYKTTDGYKKGDGYMSYWTMVELTGENKSLNLAIKTAPANKKCRELMSTRQCFLREIYFYEKIAPIFESFTAIESIPKCYKTISEENNESLVLENLKSSGFELCDCKVPMEKDHVIKALEEYAKLHAISFALKHQKPEEFAEMISGLSEIFGAELMEGFNKFASGNMEKIIKIIRDDVEVCKALDIFKNSLPEFCDVLADSKNNYGVVIHGDCWCNNIMFKYSDSNIPTQMKLIDFQLTGIANPTVELANFFFLSCDTDNLGDVQYYLSHYYRALCGALENMNCRPESIYPKRAFHDDWKLYGKFGLLMASTEFYVMMREDDEKVSIDNLDEGMLSSLMDGDIRNRDVADGRLCKLAKYMYQEGLIN